MHRQFLLLGICATFAVTGCRRSQTDNPDVASQYRGENAYEEDIVTGRQRDNYKDRGKGIDPKTLAAIDYAIKTTYQEDFARCLEEQMDANETRFLRSAFTVEFRIDPQGRANDTKVLRIETRKQDPKGGDLGEISSAPMKECIVAHISEWTFDPAPQVDYVHTYTGRVGEAF